jgi:hypothetical protein
VDGGGARSLSNPNFDETTVKSIACNTWFDHSFPISRRTLLLNAARLRPVHQQLPHPNPQKTAISDQRVMFL